MKTILYIYLTKRVYLTLLKNTFFFSANIMAEKRIYDVARNKMQFCIQLHIAYSEKKSLLGKGVTCIDTE